MNSYLGIVLIEKWDNNPELVLEILTEPVQNRIFQVIQKNTDAKFYQLA